MIVKKKILSLSYFHHRFQPYHHFIQKADNPPKEERCATQSALDQFFTFCEQDEACHAAYTDIRGDWVAVLDRLDKGPVVMSIIPPGETEPARITKMQLVQGQEL